MLRRHTKITPGERDKIARRLGRSPSSIHDELKRNRFGEFYVAITAQAKAVKRKLRAGKRIPLKDPVTYSYVLEKLRWGWNPEQISGRKVRQMTTEKNFTFISSYFP